MLPAGDARTPKANRFTRWHDKALTKSLAHGNVVMAAAVAAAVIGIVVTAAASNSVVPSIQDRDVLVRMETATGTSNTKTTAIATALQQAAARRRRRDNVVGAVGRAITGDRIVDVNSGELLVSIGRDADYDETIADIQRIADKIPTVEATVSAYSDQRIREWAA